MEYVKCCNKTCVKQASQYFRYRDNKSLAVTRAFCPEHTTAKIQFLADNGVTYKTAPKCPCCQGGFMKQWAHVAQGMCFRCNGIGHEKWELALAYQNSLSN